MVTRKKTKIMQDTESLVNEFISSKRMAFEKAKNAFLPISIKQAEGSNLSDENTKGELFIEDI